MLITAKLTKLSCFVNTVLEPCLILDKLLVTTFQLCLILMRSSDVAGQGRLTLFSSEQLMIYKVNH